jgi:hypothetical protein
MAGQGFQLAQHPWLSLIIVMLAEVVGQVLVRIVVIGLLKRPGDAPLTQFVVSLLGHAIVLFLLVPFVLKLPGGTRSFSTYLDAIRLSRVQPFFRLLLLGLSCSAIVAEMAGPSALRARRGRLPWRDPERVYAQVPGEAGHPLYRAGLWSHTPI